MTFCICVVSWCCSTLTISGASMARCMVAVLVAAVAVVAYLAMLPVPDDVADSPWMMKIAGFNWRLKFAVTFVLPTGIKNWLDERSMADSRAAEPHVPYQDVVFDRVPVRIFADPPEGGRTDKRPAIVYYHGGGWFGGSVDSYHPVTALLARNLSLLVISVEYRLAPKYPFPLPLDDCTAATVWFLKHLSHYNVDPGRVALMGDSAGGNLAAAVTQRLTFDPKYQDLPKPKLQVLLYPALQALDFYTPSYQQYGNLKTLILDRRAVAYAWDLYGRGKKGLGSSFNAMMTNTHTSSAAKKSAAVKKCLSHGLIPDEFKKTGYEVPSTDFGDEDIYTEIQELLLDPDFAPLMREDLRGLPEAYILNAEYDVLRDDGIMYAKRLEKAGVQVTWKYYKKGYHAMFSLNSRPYVSFPVSHESVSDFIHFARENL